MRKWIVASIVVMLLGCNDKSDEKPAVESSGTARTSADEGRAGSHEEWMSLCKSSSELAASIMSARQAGAEMSKMMEVSSEELSQRLVIAAYERPRMSVDANKEAMTRDFSNEIYLECIRAKS